MSHAPVTEFPSPPKTLRPAKHVSLQSCQFYLLTSFQVCPSPRTPTPQHFPNLSVSSVIILHVVFPILALSPHCSHSLRPKSNPVTTTQHLLPQLPTSCLLVFLTTREKLFIEGWKAPCLTHLSCLISSTLSLLSALQPHWLPSFPQTPCCRLPQGLGTRPPL